MFLASGVDIGSVITQTFAGLAILIGSIATILSNRRKEETDELTILRTSDKDKTEDILDLLGYIFQLRAMLAQQGIDAPVPPHLRSQDVKREARRRQS